MNKTNLIFCGLAAATLMLAGCGSAPKPRTELALTSSALQNAELAGAREHAPIELRQANEKSAAADVAMKKEEYEKAKRLSNEALVDAEYARAKAEAEQSRIALKEAQDNIQLLRTEMKRTSAE